MKKAALILTLLFASVYFTRQTHADTHVDISNNGSGSTSHVVVNNTVHSSTSQSSTSNSHTSIRIETNGKVQTFDSDNPGSVHLQSDDGTAKVDVNNNGTVSQDVKSATTNSISSPTRTITPTSSTPIPTIDKERIKKKIAEIQAKEEEKKKQLELQQNNFLQTIQSFFKRLFSFHFFS